MSVVVLRIKSMSFVLVKAAANEHHLRCSHRLILTTKMAFTEKA